MALPVSAILPGIPPYSLSNFKFYCDSAYHTLNCTLSLKVDVFAVCLSLYLASSFVSLYTQHLAEQSLDLLKGLIE